MGNIPVPAIGWQDDITIMAKNKEEEEEIVKVICNSAKKQRINFSNEKCKYLIIGNKKDNFTSTKFGEVELENVETGKVLGFHFNRKGNNESHIENKKKEAVNMVASMGITINSSKLYNVPPAAMICLYKTCILPKLMYGLKACYLTKKTKKTLPILNDKF